ncbi:hypothetical protein D9756_008310 [Leucocoprinus leucothites]|uniref:Uncharacterized protein n=1 Tax=Leucocoprinus leucothites TaxID=201217 RepID=A0A8H5FW95_9AGAR|nr:hypothetical protein D9756_008310 [Leucoagaricus leucothites]
MMWDKERWRIGEDVREEYFAEDVVEEVELELCWEIGVDAVLAEKLVVLKMVFLVDDIVISNGVKQQEWAPTLNAAA